MPLELFHHYHLCPSTGTRQRLGCPDPLPTRGDDRDGFGPWAERRLSLHTRPGLGPPIPSLVPQKEGQMSDRKTQTDTETRRDGPIGSPSTEVQSLGDQRGETEVRVSDDRGVRDNDESDLRG